MKSWKVWSNIDAEGDAVWFPRLQKLHLYECPKLEANLPFHIPSLRELVINKCDQLASVLPRVPSIHPLEVSGCPSADLASALDLTSITTLRLEGLTQLVMLPSEIIRLSSLRDLRIQGCKNLNSLENVRLPEVLRSLSIKQCETLEFLPEGLLFLNHLQDISLDKCPCLIWVQDDSLPKSLQSLDVKSCERLEFPIPLEMMHQYTSLEILFLTNTGRHLVSFPLGFFPNLRYLQLRRCKDLENVYIPEPEEIVSNNLMSLSKLIIRNCPKLKMVGKATIRGEATVLPAPNLTGLHIFCCEQLKPVLLQTEEEILLSKLQSLTIENWDKMPSCWSPRISLLRFCHLLHLHIQHHSAECFPDETLGSLPSSLKELFVLDFPKLRYLNGKALQSLTSLQSLTIDRCPLLQGLPKEGLPPSLGCLIIWKCPLLEERCPLEKGYYWSKISHLPFVWINGRYITGP